MWHSLLLFLRKFEIYYLVFSLTVGLDRKEVLSLNVQDHYISIEIRIELYKCA
jgi:hypothetical protein